MRYRGEPIETIFFGGGTPSLLSPKQFETVRQIFPAQLPNLKEWTVECSPLTVTRDRLLALRDMGVTRISIGIETFNEKFLKVLNRRQTLAMIHEAYERLRDFTFDVNLDLMFAIPGQQLCDWQDDLQRAIALRPDHISTYCLTLEGDTPLADRYQKKMRTAEQRGERFHRMAQNFLNTAGYEHYEVSNFAKPGKRCLHNVRIWQMNNWLGIGPAAASQYGGRRFKNISHLDQWMTGISGGSPYEEDIYPVDGTLLVRDSVIFGLRMREGIQFPKNMNISIKNACLDLFKNWSAQGLMKYVNGTYCPTERGLLLADYLAVEILNLHGWQEL
jgi:oxygen-independent coproporphyrinogen-3 oxidase